jgi:hypothetical protein
MRHKLSQGRYDAENLERFGNILGQIPERHPILKLNARNPQAAIDGRGCREGDGLYAPLRARRR